MSSENPYTAPMTQSGNVPATAPDMQSLLFSFTGRVPRRVYWGVSIAAVFIFYVIVFIAAMAFGRESAIPSIITVATYIPLLWILFAVGIKRWHDRDKSGWWVLIGLVPIVGAIWAFVEQGCLRGTVGPNNYGSDPT